MKNQAYRERECVHQDQGAEGEFYNGVFYLQALQRLPVDDAVEISGKVSPFFWSDASHILIWLCRDCAAEVGVNDSPRALRQAGRRAG
jgi:hypothetical protein